MMDLIKSPVKFFDERVSSSCRGAAVVAVLVSAALLSVVSVFASLKSKPFFDAVASTTGTDGSFSVSFAMSVVGAPTAFVVLFGLQSFLLCCFYWLVPGKERLSSNEYG